MICSAKCSWGNSRLAHAGWVAWRFILEVFCEYYVNRNLSSHQKQCLVHEQGRTLLSVAKMENFHGKARCQRLDWQMFLILAVLFRFDLELSITPYKILGSHAGAIKVTSRYIPVPLWWVIEPLLHRTSVFIQNTLCLPQVLMMQLSMYFMEWYTLI